MVIEKKHGTVFHHAVQQQLLLSGTIVKVPPLCPVAGALDVNLLSEKRDMRRD